MPECTIQWATLRAAMFEGRVNRERAATNEARAGLFGAFVGDDAGLVCGIVHAFEQTGLAFSIDDIEVVPSAFHEAAREVPSCKIVVKVNLRPDGRPYAQRDEFLMRLALFTRNWLEDRSIYVAPSPGYLQTADLKTLVVQLETAGRMTGIFVDLGTLTVQSCWDTAKNLTGATIR